MNHYEKLKAIIERTQCELAINYNGHKAFYTSTSDEIDNLKSLDAIDATPSVIDKIIEMDSLISIHCYPDNPIGSYCVHHYSFDAAVDEMYDALFENK
jgi:hypothetical protein